MSEPVIIIINPPTGNPAARFDVNSAGNFKPDNTAFERAISAINKAREEGGHVQLFRGT